MNVFLAMLLWTETNPSIVGIEPIRFQLDANTGKHRFAPRDTIHF